MNRKYLLNKNLFKIIDSEWKAYFLGLIFADGNIQKDRYRLTLSLSKKDKEILQKLSKQMGC